MIDWANTAILGPCAMTTVEHALEVCGELVKVRDQMRANGFSSFDFIYKSSYSKANRTTAEKFSGVDYGEAILTIQSIKKKYRVRVISDVHSVEEVRIMGPFLDVIQIPHSLSRYTKIIQAAARTGKYVVIKKGTFLSCSEAQASCDKVNSTGYFYSPMVVERGTQCGSSEVIVDMKNFKKLDNRSTCIDASHPSGGREYVAPLALAGAAAGADTLFLELDTEPDKAPCDGHHMLTPEQAYPILHKFWSIKELL